MGWLVGWRRPVRMLCNSVCRHFSGGTINLSTVLIKLHCRPRQQQQYVAPTHSLSLCPLSLNLKLAAKFPGSLLAQFSPHFRLSLALSSWPSAEFSLADPRFPGSSTERDIVRAQISATFSFNCRPQFASSVSEGSTHTQHPVYVYIPYPVH